MEKEFVVINKDKHLSIAKNDIVAHGIEKTKADGKDYYKGWFDMVNGRTYHTEVYDNLGRCQKEIEVIVK